VSQLCRRKRAKTRWRYVSRISTFSPVQDVDGRDHGPAMTNLSVTTMMTAEIWGNCASSAPHIRRERSMLRPSSSSVPNTAIIDQLLASSRQSLLTPARRTRWIDWHRLRIFRRAHYTFLDMCVPAAVDRLAIYCKDGPGVDRDAVHAQTLERVRPFFIHALGDNARE
jgi:hypothetical protein